MGLKPDLPVLKQHKLSGGGWRAMSLRRRASVARHIAAAPRVAGLLSFRSSGTSPHLTHDAMALRHPIIVSRQLHRQWIGDRATHSVTSTRR